MFRYLIPAFTLGIIFSFALPIAPSFKLILIFSVLLFVLSIRFKSAKILLILILGLSYGIFKTEKALDYQWPSLHAETKSYRIKIGNKVNV